MQRFALSITAVMHDTPYRTMGRRKAYSPLPTPHPLPGNRDFKQSFSARRKRYHLNLKGFVFGFCIYNLKFIILSAQACLELFNGISLISQPTCLKVNSKTTILQKRSQIDLYKREPKKKKSHSAATFPHFFALNHRLVES